MEQLADTNALLRYFRRDGQPTRTVRLAVRRLKREGYTFHAATQNYVELWNVATRPAARNGLGMSPSDADEMLRRALRNFPVIPDSPAFFPEWQRLVKKYAVSGVQVHDARLVAVMKVHAITHILTLNVGDFARFAPEGIVVVDPASV